MADVSADVRQVNFCETVKTHWVSVLTLPTPLTEVPETMSNGAAGYCVQ